MGYYFRFRIRYKTQSMKLSIFCSIVLLLCISCSKSAEEIANPYTNLGKEPTAQPIEYKIKKGEQYSEGTLYKQVELSALRFTVRFDSSSIYQTASQNNQYDINKLYGFSDNNEFHHQYSARFGWRWSDNALRLFAYVYNNGVRQSEEIGIIPIGKDVNCSIEADGTQYIFKLNDIKKTLPRLSTTPKAKGYMLYPYFGGDEYAPHDIRIWIMD